MPSHFKHTDMKKLKFWIVEIHTNLKYNITDSKNFILTNMETLTQGENGNNDCIGSGSVACGNGLYKLKVAR